MIAARGEEGEEGGRESRGSRGSKGSRGSRRSILYSTLNTQHSTLPTTLHTSKTPNSILFLSSSFFSFTFKSRAA
jgi:hypothetical protein